MSKIHTKLIVVIFLFVSLQTVAQSVYNYRIREYYNYSESKKRMISDRRDKVRTSLIIDDKKRVIIFKISGVKEFATFKNLISKGIITSGNGKTFLHYVYKGDSNDELHFYISKEAAKIESYGSMVQLFE